MITVLLQKIIDLLSEHFPSVITLLSKLNLIEEDTEEMRGNLASMKTTLEDVDTQATAAAGKLATIDTTLTATAGNVAAIKSNSDAIKNNIITMSTNVGNVATYTQNTANNTLDIDQKITSIASDTTDLRTSNNDIYAESSKIYDAVKWLLSDKDMEETETGENSVSFDTDYTEDLVKLDVGLTATQSGTGNPAPDNVRPISGYSNMGLTVNGQNVSIALGQTVYDGVLDLTSGVLKITSELKRINTATAIYTAATSGNGIRVGNFMPVISRLVNGLCNMAIISTSTTTNTAGKIALGIDNRNLYWFGILDILGFTTLTEMQTWLDNNDVYVLYELDSPLEVSLTPEQIATIKGLNTISTDTNGEITVTYKESIKHYLDKND